MTSTILLSLSAVSLCLSLLGFTELDGPATPLVNVAPFQLFTHVVMLIFYFIGYVFNTNFEPRPRHTWQGGVLKLWVLQWGYAFIWQ